MLTGKERYVYRLMKATCSCGNKDFKQNLNVKKDHGVLFRDMEYPIMNANDHVSGDNIVTFGRCKSLRNPGGASSGAAIAATSIIPIVGPLIYRCAIGCKCEPMTLVPWINVNDEYYIDGAPALTLESTLPCYYGGTITIVLERNEDEEEAKENSGEEVDRDKTKQLPSEVQEKIDAFCDEEMATGTSAAKEALAEEMAQEEARKLEMEENARAFNEAVQNLKLSVKGSTQVDYDERFILQPFVIEQEKKEPLFEPFSLKSVQQKEE